jgi:hypothetical protein
VAADLRFGTADAGVPRHNRSSPGLCDRRLCLAEDLDIAAVSVTSEQIGARHLD